jgi:hypothetical protein
MAFCFLEVESSLRRPNACKPSRLSFLIILLRKINPWDKSKPNLAVADDTLNQTKVSTVETTLDTNPLVLL